MTKLLSVLLLNFILSVPTYALSRDQKTIRFPVETEALMKGEIHFAIDILAPLKLTEKYPELYDLDSLAFMQEPNVTMVIGKSAYIVDKPAGFFDHEKPGDLDFLKHIMGQQKLEKLGENTFKVTVPGEFSHSYVMRTFFDSDEISTLPNSKVIRAVTQAKKLDVIAQSASSSVFREMVRFTKYMEGAIQVTTYIPMKENKTLVLNYSLSAVKKPFAKSKLLKSNFRVEAEAQRNLINSYK